MGLVICPPGQHLGNFERITYEELLRQHTTRKGISPQDKSVYVVAGAYRNTFSDAGRVLKYCESVHDKIGNRWLQRQVGNTVCVFLNLKSGSHRYFRCGPYQVADKTDGFWVLTRVADGCAPVAC